MPVINGVRSAAAPERSLLQRLDALQLANDVRSDRARLKGRVRAGEVGVDEVLCSPAPSILSMKASELLLAAPKVGRVKVQKILARAQISPSRTVGGLTDRQRLELIAVLPRHVRRPTVVG